MVTQGVAASTSGSSDVMVDAVLEARVQHLAQELRCVVCQNQTLADSHSDLAADLRQRIREQLAAGHSEDDVRDHLVQRYGDFVLYRPPLKASTGLLWFGPLLLLGIGLVVLLRQTRRGRDLADDESSGGTP
jgi:cytochrome c-type biogenesis protein CcmH